MDPIRIVLISAIVISALILWWKAGFKCPIYIHVLAGLATALGVFIAKNTDSSLPVNQWWLLGKWWIALIMPALIYGAFAVYGVGVYSKKD